MVRRGDALEYHRQERPGKIEVKSTKPCMTQRDLAMAYTPGVAEPCREIGRDSDKVFEYTARGNLVAVVTNGTSRGSLTSMYSTSNSIRRILKRSSRL